MSIPASSARRWMFQNALAATLLVCSAAGVWPTQAQAFVVGETVLHSGYSRPLHVTVPITLTSPSEAADASEIKTELLPLSAYESFGLIAPPLGSDAFDLEITGSGLSYTVELTTRQIIREPFVTLMLDIKIGYTRVVRELSLIFELQQDLGDNLHIAGAGTSSIGPRVLPLPLPDMFDEPREAPAKSAKPDRIAPKADGNKQKRAPVEAEPLANLSRYRMDTVFKSYAVLADTGNTPVPADQASTPAVTDTQPGIDAIEQGASAAPAAATPQRQAAKQGKGISSGFGF